MKCASCGANNPDGNKFCGDCGKELAPSSEGAGEKSRRKCAACGRALTEEANACPYCGHWVKRSLF